MSNKWREIWENREINEAELYCGETKRVFLELKRIAGFDITSNALDYEQFYNQYIETKNELEFCAISKSRPIESIFELGCGCGANLFLFQKDKIEVGGIDYSGAEIEIARKILNNPKELICDEAVAAPTELKYDAVISNSVFSYFESYEYARKVLEIMYCKAKYSIGLIDIHDIKKKEAFIEFRKSIIEDYEERYEGLPKFFYDKAFFLDFAEQHDMSIRITQPKMRNYWNNDFVFNCFLIKNTI